MKKEAGTYFHDQSAHNCAGDEVFVCSLQEAADNTNTCVVGDDLFWGVARGASVGAGHSSLSTSSNWVATLPSSRRSELMNALTRELEDAQRSHAKVLMFNTQSDV